MDTAGWESAYKKEPSGGREEGCQAIDGSAAPPVKAMAAASLTSLSRRGAAAEEAFYKQEQELRVLSLRKALEATPSGRLRLAACEASAPPPRADSMLPAIARQYLRLDTPQLVRQKRRSAGGAGTAPGHHPVDAGHPP